MRMLFVWFLLKQRRAYGVRISDWSSSVFASDLLIGEGIDVALRMGSLRDSTLTARMLGQCRRLVLATPEYFARAGIPATPAELSTHQAIALETGRASGRERVRQNV